VILPALQVCETAASQNPTTRRKPTSADAGKYFPDWRGWHAFRRGPATNLNRLGVDDSVIPRILRHSNIVVTQTCYNKTPSEDAKAAMRKLETALNDTYVTPKQPTPGAKAVMECTAPMLCNPLCWMDLEDIWRRGGFEPSVLVLAHT
jgi:hypothetical protein